MPDVTYYAATTNSVWTSWASGASTAVTFETLDLAHSRDRHALSVWRGWISETSVASTVLLHSDFIVPEQPMLSAEQEARLREYQAQQAAARERRLREQAELMQQQAEAEARAVRLLLENLTRQQRADFEKDKSFVVRGSRSGRRFRIRHGWSGNIDVVNDKGFIEQRLCIHPSIQVPNSDNMLAQKLLIETDEDYVLRIANQHSIPAQRAPVLPPLVH